MKFESTEKELEQLEEKQLDSEFVFDGVLLKVYKDKVQLPNGNTSGREYIKHNGAVCVVAVTDDNKIVVERQYRYPFKRVLTELPAGKLDSIDEDPLEAAKRELREETGILADNIEYIGGLIPTCAYSTEIIHMYMATGLHFGERELDEDEFLNVSLMPMDELVDKIISGEIQDSKTQAAVLKCYAILQKRKER